MDESDSSDAEFGDSLVLNQSEVDALFASSERIDRDSKDGLDDVEDRISALSSVSNVEASHTVEALPQCSPSMVSEAEVTANISISADSNSANSVSSQPTDELHLGPQVFKISNDILQVKLASRRNGRDEYWSHRLYRGQHDERIKVHYCTRYMESEMIARTLLNEPVLGLDLEWRPRYKPGIKPNVSLIQIASETDIALFHIALHYGTTAQQLLAPSLRKIIESPNILKTGVNIVGADGSRLRKYFKIQPQGLFELSHLHRALLNQSEENHNGRAGGRGLVALAKLVDLHLGLPLQKDNSVRCSDWSKPNHLNETQIDYAASDAFAGYQLFRVMDAKRRECQPPVLLPACDRRTQPKAEPKQKSDPKKAAKGKSSPRKVAKRDVDSTNNKIDKKGDNTEDPGAPRPPRKKRFIHPDELTSKTSGISQPLDTVINETAPLERFRAVHGTRNLNDRYDDNDDNDNGDLEKDYFEKIIVPTARRLRPRS